MSGIDLKLPPPREAATLNIEAVLEDIGEAYNVNAFRFATEAPQAIREGRPFKMRTRSWPGEFGPISVTEANVHVRVILHEQANLPPSRPQ